jgi:putative ABC transport system permease protein
MAWRPNSRSVYRTLLLAYPAEFRDEYGAEMDRMVGERMTGEPEAGLWLTLLGDVLRNAPREHLHILVRDLRHSLRLFAKAPGFTATALLALALGIGAAVTIFSLIDTVLLRSLPFGEAERLAYMWTPLPRYHSLPRELGPSFADVLAWRSASKSFVSITALSQRTMSVNMGGDPILVPGTIVLGNFFETLRAAPLLGRAIDVNDDHPGKDQVAVISYAFWSSRFGYDPGVLGKGLQLGGRSYRIIGVMPPDFVYPHANDFPLASASLKRTDLWIPAGLSARQEANRMMTCDAAIGRLRPGVTLRQAQAEMSAIESGLDPLNLPEMRGTQSLLVPLIETAVGPVRGLMRLLAGAVILVLLIACGNVANLLIARAATREHEMGVRTALGAPRSRLVRQVLTESLFLSLMGGALGALLCLAAVRVLARMNPGDIPRFDEISIDWRVLLFALLISVITGIVFGAFPALASARANIVDLLREGGGRGIAGASARVRYGLVVADVALAVVLLRGAGLFIRSYLYVQSEEKGFAPSTLTMSLAADLQSRVPPARIMAMSRTAVERVAALPGVVSAGATNTLPLSHHESTSTFRVEGYDNRPNQTAGWRQVAGDFFGAMQIPLIAGRYLTPEDIPDQPTPVPRAVVVNETFARVYFHGRSAVGGHVQRGAPGTLWSTIVGVVADVRHSNLETPPTPTLYQPSWSDVSSLAIRTTLPPDAMVSAVRQAVRESGLPFLLADIQTMRERTSKAEARRRFQTVLLAAFAGIAVFLALVGLYGLLSYGVRQRTAEIGVRMALGAQRSQVVGMVLRDGLLLTAAGLLIGLPVAGTVARWSASLLYGIHVLDPVTFIAVPVLMMAAAALACVLPAWKASQVDPVSSLRHQ